MQKWQQELNSHLASLKDTQRGREEQMIQRYIDGKSSLAVLETQLRTRKKELATAVRNRDVNSQRAEDKAELAKTTAKDHPGRQQTIEKYLIQEKSYRARTNSWGKKVVQLTDQVASLQNKVDRIKAGRAAKELEQGGPGAGGAAAAAGGEQEEEEGSGAVQPGEAKPSDSRRTNPDPLEYSAANVGEVRSPRPRQQFNGKALVNGLGTWAQRSVASLQQHLQHPPRLGDVARELGSRWAPPMPPGGIKMQPGRLMPKVI